MSEGDIPNFEELEGKNVVILDYSYPKNIMKQLLSKVRTCVLLDHHHTAMLDLHGIILSSTLLLFA